MTASLDPPAHEPAAAQRRSGPTPPGSSTEISKGRSDEGPASTIFPIGALPSMDRNASDQAGTTLEKARARGSAPATISTAASGPSAVSNRHRSVKRPDSTRTAFADMFPTSSRIILFMHPLP